MMDFFIFYFLQPLKGKGILVTNASGELNVEAACKQSGFEEQTNFNGSM